jgi:hypothetical protein
MAKVDPSRELLRDLLERGQNEFFPKLRSRVLSIIKIYNHPIMQEKLKLKSTEVKYCLLDVQVHICGNRKWTLTFNYTIIISNYSVVLSW